jgi:hypothetical protein
MIPAAHSTTQKVMSGQHGERPGDRLGLDRIELHAVGKHRQRRWHGPLETRVLQYILRAGPRRDHQSEDGQDDREHQVGEKRLPGQRFAVRLRTPCLAHPFPPSARFVRVHMLIVAVPESCRISRGEQSPVPDAYISVMTSPGVVPEKYVISVRWPTRPVVPRAYLRALSVPHRKDVPPWDQ